METRACATCARAAGRRSALSTRRAAPWTARLDAAHHWAIVAGGDVADRAIYDRQRGWTRHRRAIVEHLHAADRLSILAQPQAHDLQHAVCRLHADETAAPRANPQQPRRRAPNRRGAA